MKFRHIVFAAAATFVALTGCNKEIDYGPAKVEVDKTEIEVPKDAGSVTVSLNATIDWAAKVDGDAADWLDISPSAGGPSLEAQTLTIKYTGNTGFDREASILVQGDVLHKTFINVKQKGEQGDPSVITRISVKEFLEKKDTEREYILEGEISNIANASYYGFDLTDATGTVACAFPTNFADFSASLKKGGVVKIQGKYAFYESKQTHQLQNGLILEYTAPADVDPSKIETVSIKEFITKADPKTPYRIVGEASDITYKDNYKAFTVSDDSGETLCIYSPTNYADFKDEMLDAGAGTVSVYGTYEYYASKQLHEMVDGVIESFTPGQGGGDDYENAPAKTVDEFVSAADGDTYYKLTGTVSGFNAKYCSFDLTDKTGKIYVYSVINKDEWSSKVQDGGTVTLAGKYLYYEKGSKHEVVDAYILSFTAGEGGDEGDDDAPTEFTKVTIAEFLAASVSTTKWYQLTGVITNIENTQYGNFTIKDNTGEVYVYGLTKTYVTANDKSFASIGLKKGDTVTLNGLRGEYNGTIETAGAPPAFYVSHEAGEEEKVPEGSVVLSFPDDNKSNNGLGTKQYETEWTAKSGSNEFKIFAFNNNKWSNGWTFIRAGRKNDASTATIATATPIAAKVSEVVVTFDSMETKDVKSIKVISASDASFTKDVAEVSVTPAKGDVAFKIAAPAADMYYKLVVDCSASSLSSPKNGFVQVSRVAYIAAE